MLAHRRFRVFTAAILFILTLGWFFHDGGLLVLDPTRHQPSKQSGDGGVQGQSPLMGEKLVDIPERDSRGSTTSNHPVQLLHARAQVQFEELLSRQSKTSEDARAEYKRRYNRDPPPGFTEWVAYALSVKSPIIDDYDMLNDGISPFFKYNASELLRLINMSEQRGENPNLGRCQWVDGQFPPQAGCLRTWLDPIVFQLGEAAKLVPNVTLLFNMWDEPCDLVVTPKHDEWLLHWTLRGSSPHGPAIAESCKMGSHVREGRRPKWTTGEAVDTQGLPFVTNIDDSKDLCAHSEYNDLHGFLIAPSTRCMIPAHIPLLSQAAPAPYQDILMPSSAYASEDEPTDDVSWDDKKASVYWAGSTTGSWSHGDPKSWRNAARQRAALRWGPKHHDQDEQLQYLERDPRTGNYHPYASSAWNASLYDIAITRVTQCFEPACAEQEEVFAPLHMAAPEAAFDHRYVLDIDGNSYTGRYSRLLASHSAPLKMTIFREWHDERLVPWLHYFPLSQSMDELPELMRFLATTEAGDTVGREVAEAGRTWFERGLSRVHQGVYLYRLFLEMAWLQNEERDPLE